MSENLTHHCKKVKPFTKQSRDGFSLIPNIIFEIGLEHYARDVYVYMKRVAGENGQCWKSIPTIAKQLGISENTVRRAVKDLLKRRPELGGKSLIVKVASKHPTKTYEVVNIWTENSRLMGLHNRHPTPSPEAPHPFTTGWSTPSPQADKEDYWKKTTEEDPFKKIPFLKKEKIKHENDPQIRVEENHPADSDDQEIVGSDDPAIFMPPPPGYLDWLLEDATQRI